MSSSLLSRFRAGRTAGVAAFVLLTTTLGSVSAGALEKTSLGGYGELHLNYTKPDKGEADPAVLDFHRYVLFLGYEWNDQWAFRSELEVEHNFVKDGHGELELEQAYVHWVPLPQFSLSAGVMLPAVGLINRWHEPPRFLSVERPYYSKVIVPTTWFGNGAGIGGLVGGMLEYSLQVMEGLDDREFRAKDALRAGRQKGYKPSLENVLTVVSADFVGMPGAIGGISVSVNELVNDGEGGHLYDRAVLWELHGTYEGKGLVVAAEFGSIHYTASDADGEQLTNSQGFYVDLGYDAARLWQAEKLKLIPFARFSMLNPAGTLGGDNVNEDAGRHRTRFMGGVSVLPIPRVAFKFDVSSDWIRGTDKRATLVAVGAGYEF